MRAVDNYTQKTKLKCEFPFALQEDSVRKTLHSKRSYGSRTKVSGWQRFGNTLPFDNDPLCSEGYNLHLSHYNRLGWYKDVEWITSTQEALRQFYNRRIDFEINPNKTLINLYTEIRLVENLENHSFLSPTTF